MQAMLATLCIFAEDNLRCLTKALDKLAGSNNVCWKLLLSLPKLVLWGLMLKRVVRLAQFLKSRPSSCQVLGERLPLGSRQLPRLQVSPRHPDCDNLHAAPWLHVKLSQASWVWFKRECWASKNTGGTQRGDC